MTEAIDALELKTRVAGILNHWPVAGLAVGVVRGGSLAWFHGHGVADIESGTPIGQDTVEPGTRWAYSNHGFATLGQIVADASGFPLGHYLRERVFGPSRHGKLRPGPVWAGAAPPGHRVRAGLARAQGGHRPRDGDSWRRLGLLHHQRHGPLRRGTAVRRRQ